MNTCWGVCYEIHVENLGGDEFISDLYQRTEKRLIQQSCVDNGQSQRHQRAV